MTSHYLASNLVL